MQVNRIALLLAMLFNLSDLNAMDKNFKYYSSFYSNYTHPFQVKAEDKISEKEALSKKTYYKVLFEIGNNIKRIEKVFGNKCIFIFEYDYSTTGDFLGFRKIPCPKC
ncbi:hypothetical protein [Dentiradicibacter hellwigii]|uniref:Uncharacterized protein n=1 Tax=Dentiradicibacter hellwigii TaxID=3149053 RepID=A0ABV4UFR5_9RHOO